jgi:hypothetical protein
MNIESTEPLDVLLKKYARHATLAPAVLFKALAGGATLIVPTQAAWGGRGREILPVEERAQGTIDFASAKRARLARRELERAHAAAVEREHKATA